VRHFDFAHYLDRKLVKLLEELCTIRPVALIITCACVVPWSLVAIYIHSKLAKLLIFAALSYVLVCLNALLLLKLNSIYSRVVDGFVLSDLHALSLQLNAETAGLAEQAAASKSRPTLRVPGVRKRGAQPLC
jgi:hypothetical protein